VRRRRLLEFQFLLEIAWSGLGASKSCSFIAGGQDARKLDGKCCTAGCQVVVDDGNANVNANADCRNRNRNCQFPFSVSSFFTLASFVPPRFSIVFQLPNFGFPTSFSLTRIEVRSELLAIVTPWVARVGLAKWKSKPVGGRSVGSS
jgi:hypothetical protein